jgi:hypothetical protein
MQRRYMRKTATVFLPARSGFQQRARLRGERSGRILVDAREAAATPTGRLDAKPRPAHFTLVEAGLDHLERRRCVPSSMQEICETAKEAR